MECWLSKKGKKGVWNSFLKEFWFLKILKRSNFDAFFKLKTALHLYVLISLVFHFLELNFHFYTFFRDCPEQIDKKHTVCPGSSGFQEFLASYLRLMVFFTTPQ